MPDETSGIFIFTKDKTASLKSTLNSIESSNHNIYIIDDSFEKINQLANQALVSNHTYLGIPQFANFIDHHKIDHLRYSFLLKELGNKSWNLGYARNFALLFARSMHLNRILFMDDDIFVPSPTLIDCLFDSLQDYEFVGAHIAGLVDDSVLGHIATDLGVNNERTLSGGFMMFNPFQVEHYFLNIYNEDWIWLLLYQRNKKFLQSGEVFQTISNPFNDYQNKVIFQEYGEIFIDGIIALNANNSLNLCEEEFWIKIMDERKKYINTLISLSLADSKYQYLEILNYVIGYPKVYSAISFQNSFKEYSSNLAMFKSFYNSLS